MWYNKFLREEILKKEFVTANEIGALLKSNAMQKGYLFAERHKLECHIEHGYALYRLDEVLEAIKKDELAKIMAKSG